MEALKIFIIIALCGPTMTQMYEGYDMQWVFVKGGVRYLISPSLEGEYDYSNTTREKFAVSLSTFPGQSTTEFYSTEDPTTEGTTTPQDETTRESTTSTTTQRPIDTYVITVNSSVAFVGIDDTKHSLVFRTNINVEPYPEFGFRPVDGSLTRFHLIYRNEPIVTARTRPPFDFFTQSTYPFEPVAEFLLEPFQFNVDLIYQGIRENILTAAEEIVKFRESERDYLFTELLSLMSSYTHLSGGNEVFLVGELIKKFVENPLISSAFISLPKAVQLIITKPITYTQINVILPSSETFPLKEDYALQTPRIHFPFYFSDPISNGYDISYRDSSTFWDLEESILRNNVSNYPIGRWEFHLDQDDITLFKIYFRSYPTLPTSTMSASSTTSTTPTTTRVPSSTEYSTTTTQEPIKYILLPLRYSTFENQFCTFTGPGIVDVRFSVENFHFEVSDFYVSRVDLLETSYLVGLGTDPGAQYSELLDLMEEKKHVVGRDIFTVGSYIWESIQDVNNPVIKKLPESVQLLVCSALGNDISLFYLQTSTNVTFPMKYSWASDLHENIQPFIFQVTPTTSNSNVSYKKFAISYGSLASAYRLFLNEMTMELEHELNPEPNYEFDLYLREDLKSFEITYLVVAWLEAGSDVPDFYFGIYEDGAEPAVFVAELFVL